MRNLRPGGSGTPLGRKVLWLVSGAGSALLAAGLLPASAALAGAVAPAGSAPSHQSRHFVAPAPPAWAPHHPHAGHSAKAAPFLSAPAPRAAAIVHTYTVTTTSDATPAACPATTTDPCTLRQAVTQANTDGTLDQIVVPSAGSPYLLESGQLSVTDPAGVVITGAGAAKSVVEADSTSPSYPFRVFQISNGSAVQMTALTVTGGSSSPSSTPAEDGNGGGIEVLAGSLTLSNAVVTANAAASNGGGIYVAGTNSVASASESQAYLSNVTVSSNTAAGAGGGGGLDVEGQAVISGGEVGSNTLTGTLSTSFPVCPCGGGIRLGDDGTFFPSLSASGLTVDGNTGAGQGGGIYNAGQLDLHGGVIGGPLVSNGNTAVDYGAGLDNEQTAALTKVAVTNNTATNNLGGGIYNDHRITVTGGSITGNSVTGLFSDSGGLDNEGQATLSGVTVFGNAAGGAGGIGNDGTSLSVTGGSVSQNIATNGFGGGVFNNSGAASFRGTSITANSALPAPKTTNVTFGGGIYSVAPLTLTGVHLGTAALPNAADEGGGLFTKGVGATVSHSVIAGNQALNSGSGAGGGIFNADKATDILVDSTVTGNSADGSGGGILNFGGAVSITGSTLNGNSATGGSSGSGGGIANLPDTPNSDNGTLTMLNDTVTGNSAGGATTPGTGGGLDNEAGASASLTNVTLSNNQAGSGGAGGGIHNNGALALKGTIVAGNTVGGTPGNCSLTAPLSSNGYNLSSDTSCGLTGAGDQTGVNPLLGPLASNGGPTKTQALKTGSPAIDSDATCPPPKTDQRGVTRHSPCDIGAYESPA